MSKVPFAAVRQALALIGVDDPDNVRRVEMDPQRIVVERHALRDGRIYADDQGRLLVTQEVIRIAYTETPTGLEPGVYTFELTPDAALRREATP